MQSEPGQELSEEERLCDSQLWASHDEMLARAGDIGEPGHPPDTQIQEPAPQVFGCKDYEPPPTLELIRRGGRIEFVRVEWHNRYSNLLDQSDQDWTPVMPSSVYHSMYLPTGVGPYASAREVYQAIYDVLKDCSSYQGSNANF